MLQKILLEDIEVFITRKNIKNLYLRVYPPDGRVNLSVPLSFPEEGVLSFLDEKVDWIKNNRVKMIKKNSNVKQWSSEERLAGKKHLENKVPFYINKWEKIMDLEIQSWNGRLMKTRWGSCNISKKRISLNISLSEKSEDVLEYVIVHEMIHLKERYHNKNFYKYMDYYMPNWKELKKKLSNA